MLQLIQQKLEEIHLLDHTDFEIFAEKHLDTT